MDLEKILHDLQPLVKPFEHLFRGKRGPAPRMTLAEVMAITIAYQFSGHKNFKSYYLSLQKEHKDMFPKLFSYSRFIEIMPRLQKCLEVVLPLIKGKHTGKYLIDSTPLPVCKFVRNNKHRVFELLADFGKNCFGFFYGWKLHLITNERREYIAHVVTPGNVHDIQVLPELCQGLTGAMGADKGYISAELREELAKKGLRLVTKVRKNMQPIDHPPEDKKLLSSRHLIETTFGILKQTFNIDHTRHRSPANFMTNVLSALAAYCMRSKLASPCAAS